MIQKKKKKIGKLDFIIINNFFSLKGTVNRMKRQNYKLKECICENISD